MSSYSIQILPLGQLIRNKRESHGLLLRQVAAYLDIDPAILCKIEKGVRFPSRKNILRLAEILKIDHEQLLIQYLSDKIAYEVKDDVCAAKALKVAEKKLRLINSK